MTLSFELITKDKLTDEHRKIFADLLKKQGKVKGILIEKADRCKLICRGRGVYLVLPGSGNDFRNYTL